MFQYIVRNATGHTIALCRRLIDATRVKNRLYLYHGIETTIVVYIDWYEVKP